MFIVTRVIVTREWNQPRCPSADEWIKQMWYLDTMEFCLAVKKIEIVLFSGMWMQLEIIMLSEISQSLKDKQHMFSFIRKAEI